MYIHVHMYMYTHIHIHIYLGTHHHMKLHTPDSQSFLPSTGVFVCVCAFFCMFLNFLYTHIHSLKRYAKFRIIPSIHGRVCVCACVGMFLNLLYTQVQLLKRYAKSFHRPRMEKSHLKRHELLFCRCGVRDAFTYIVTHS